jgi:hypothetical protein
MRTVYSVLTLLVATYASATLAAQEVRAILVERIQELDLTDEQEAKIAEIQKAGRPKGPTRVARPVCTPALKTPAALASSPRLTTRSLAAEHRL